MEMQPENENTKTGDTDKNQGGRPQQGNTGVDNVDKHKTLAVIGYILPFLFVIPLITEASTNKFARYNANQQLLLLLFWVGGQIVASLFAFVLIGFLLYPVIYVVGIILMVMGIINSLNGEMKPLPVLGKYELIK
jgi:uncharacterized membrane protein